MVFVFEYEIKDYPVEIRVNAPHIEEAENVLMDLLGFEYPFDHLKTFFAEDK